MNTTKSILLLHDYRRYFYSSVRFPGASMEVDKIENYLRVAGYNVDVKGFADIDVRDGDFRNSFVVYTSQEDDNLYYKGYIEDVILALQLKGAVLIPRFELFRAHHNKVFMEMLRDIIELEDVKTIKTQTFGCYEELLRKVDAIRFPVVIKPASGAMSTGVALANTKQKLLDHAKKISLSATWLERLKQIVKLYVREPKLIKSIHRNKFIAQTFITGLKNDYKVLVYGDKYYPFSRSNRDNDFRASGSGRFNFRCELPPGLLDFSENIFKAFDCPFISLDVGFDGQRFHLLEMQFLMFGNIGVEKSVRHFKRVDGVWKENSGPSELERVFADSIIRFVQLKSGTIQG